MLLTWSKAQRLRSLRFPMSRWMRLRGLGGIMLLAGLLVDMAVVTDIWLEADVTHTDFSLQLAQELYPDYGLLSEVSVLA